MSKIRKQIRLDQSIAQELHRRQEALLPRKSESLQIGEALTTVWALEKIGLVEVLAAAHEVVWETGVGEVDELLVESTARGIRRILRSMQSAPRPLRVSSLASGGVDTALPEALSRSRSHKGTRP